jgi:hypothetical protein
MKDNKLGRWTVCSTALLSCVFGFLISAGLSHANEMKPGGSHVFELRIYHAVPGKGPALESVFRDASKIMAKNGINVVGYWVPNEDPVWKDTFVYIVSHPSREEAKKNWHDLHADPEFQPYVESAKPLIQKAGEQYQVDEVYMRPTDFSPMQ